MARKPTRKQKKAHNECCPTIRVKCHMVTPPAKRIKRHVASMYGESAHTYYQKVAQPPKKMCRVTVGKRFGKLMPSDAVGKKVAGLKKAMERKRCLAVVKNEGR